MPFFYGGMWIFPMIFMPLMAFGMIFLLYKMGFLKAIISTVKDITNSDYNNDSAEYCSEDPLEVINLRYAEGELTTEEYRKIKQELLN